MGVYYFDSSALVKRYARENGTNWVLSITDVKAGNDVLTARITGAEVIAAIFRRVRAGSIRAPDAATVAHDFKSDFDTQYQLIEASPRLVDQAMQLTEKHGLRGYDAVQLAAALEAQQLRVLLGLAPLFLVSSDKAKAAYPRSTNHTSPRLRPLISRFSSVELQKKLFST